MDATAAAHPTDQILQSYGLGKLDDALAQTVNIHLESCPACRRRVAEMSSDSFLGRLRNAQGSPEMSAANRSWVGGSNPERGPAVALSPPPADTLPPDLIDHPDYEIVRELGRGGMGVVYLAQNKLMRRPEVLKVVGRHLVERPGVRDRFLREVQSAAKLQHKNIVAAYSALRLGESLVLAMEYVDGLDLAKMVKTKGPLPVAHACYFIHQAALGLQHAHERGMVHRDIKPANLILASEGKKSVVKVLDFGLAKVTSEGQADGALTREGQMLGTPEFIAPEQIRDAQSADIRADIYSLGCTFYYLLTGQPPFRGDSLWDLYQAHFSMDAGPLNLVRPEVPVELAAVVAKMMAKEPVRRFQIPGEVAQALTPFFKKGSVGAPASNAEVSQLGQPQGRPNSPASGPVPTGTATNLAPAPATPVKNPAASACPEPQWASQITFTETEPAKGPAPDIAVLKRQNPRWLWPAVAAGVLLLGFVAGWAVVSSKRPQERPERGGAEPIQTASKDARPDAVPAVKNLSAPDLIKNKIEMTLKLIPADEFIMGSPDDDKDANADEKPRHKVRINSFYLAVTEVTQAQYEAVMGNNPSYFSATGGGKAAVVSQSAGQYPVESVSWQDAIVFCNALSRKEGLTPFYVVKGENVEVPDRKNPGYRLPTEAEWEYACRARTTAKYSFGDDPSVMWKYAWYRDSPTHSSHPVRERDANGFGLFDMHGNVWEWCSDGYGGDKRALAVDPIGSPEVSGRATRGGGWDSGPRECRSALRNGIAPGRRHFNQGLRVALNPPDEIKDLSGTDRPGTRSAKESEPPQRLGEAKSVASVTVEPKLTSSGVKSKPALKLRGNWTSQTTRMDFVRIEGGEFTMGSADDEKDVDPDEKPPHKVRISPFFLGVTEVTQSQYEAVIGHNPSYFSETGGGKDKVADQATGQHPVEHVSWFDAVEFCNVLSEKAGLTLFYRVNGKNVEVPDRKGLGYRLPTEAEWEYACRAGTTAKYSFGDDPSVMNQYGWCREGGSGSSHRVGELLPNGLGLHDMHGNVWEWCSDGHDADYYKRSLREDPPGPSGASARVIRGGSFISEPKRCRSAYRGRIGPGVRESDQGFRLAINPSDEIKHLSGTIGPGTPLSKDSKTAQPLGEAKSAAPLTAARAATPSGVTPKLALKPRGDWSSQTTKIEFVPIGGGEFTMGSPNGDNQPDGDEMPRHTVRIRPFYLGVTEVTQGQYEAVMGTNPSYFSSAGGGMHTVAAQSTDRYPVESVSWLDAVRFCNALSEKEGIVHFYQVKGESVEIPARRGPGYRLPTEAEWEYACRAGAKSSYSFGDDPSKMWNYGWFAEHSTASSHPVGQLRPNGLGLYDMHGNVWEWCSDGYDGDYYKRAPADDPPGAMEASARVFRGGSWSNQPRFGRSAYRHHGAPCVWSDSLGFRVAHSARRN